MNRMLKRVSKILGYTDAKIVDRLVREIRADTKYMMDKHIEANNTRISEMAKSIDSRINELAKSTDSRINELAKNTYTMGAMLFSLMAFGFNYLHGDIQTVKEDVGSIKKDIILIKAHLMIKPTTS